MRGVSDGYSGRLLGALGEGAYNNQPPTLSLHNMYLPITAFRLFCRTPGHAGLARYKDDYSLETAGRRIKVKIIDSDLNYALLLSFVICITTIFHCLLTLSVSLSVTHSPPSLSL